MSEYVKEVPGMTEPVSAASTDLKSTGPHPGTVSDRIKARNLRRTIAQAERVRVLPGGERLFRRFSQVEILEHWVLLASFSVITFTALLEVTATSKNVADFTTMVFRNLDNVRALHNQAGVLFAALILFHAVRVLTNWFIKSGPTSMLPSANDLHDFKGAVRYLLSSSAPRPQYGRFSLEQKLTYWGTAAFSAMMILTGLIQFLQTPLARILPVTIQPITRSLHTWIGLLVLATLVPWHLYHTVIKQRNTSMFSGEMDENSMRRLHPGEYQEILAALEAYNSLKADTPIAENEPAVGTGTANATESENS